MNITRNNVGSLRRELDSAHSEIQAAQAVLTPYRGSAQEISPTELEFRTRKALNALVMIIRGMHEFLNKIERGQ